MVSSVLYQRNSLALTADGSGISLLLVACGHFESPGVSPAPGDGRLPGLHKDRHRRRGLIPVTADKLSVQVAINSWRLILERVNKTFSNFPDDQLLKEVAPGRNRLIYLWGHLTAIHDAMLPILGLGERLHPELDAIFVSSPDKAGAQLPHVGELRKYWYEVNGKLLSQFATLSADEWLQRHYAMSEEDYAKDPTRNRLAVLLSRTTHMSYHLGQITLALK
jgi:uncharacterized damage-inducible protein DinB